MAKSQSCRPGRRSSRFLRRRHAVERLEKRELLAAVAFGTNPLQPLDVNRDGAVTSIDAFRIINALARAGNPAGGIDPADEVGNFVDVSGDGKGSALDAFNVINALSRGRPILAAKLINDSGPFEVSGVSEQA